MRRTVILAGTAVAVTLTVLSARAQTPTAFDSSKAWEHLRQQVAIGPRPVGHAGQRQDPRSTSPATLAASGLKAVEQPFTGATPNGPVKMVNLIATIPGQRPERIILGSHFDTKLFTDVPVRRRERRRVEHGGPPRTGARPQGAAAAALHDRTAVPRRRGSRAANGAAPTTPTAAATTSRPPRKAGTLASIKAFILLDMIGDRNLNMRRESASTPWLTDIIWATAKRLGHQARLPRPVHADRGRPRAVPQGGRRGGRHHRPRLRPPGTRPTTPSTPSPRAACRLSGTSSSPRCRRSKRSS